jgi:hypothetical protein
MRPDHIHVEFEHPVVVPDPVITFRINPLTAFRAVKLGHGLLIQQHFPEENFSGLLVANALFFVALAHGELLSGDMF